MTQYGKSFAAELIERGKFEEAIQAASEAIGREAVNPEHFFERGTARSMLERYAEAVDDFRLARELDRQVQVLDDDMLDDSFFSALLGAARALPVAAGVARLSEYVALYPEGRHRRDAEDWTKRIRGELKTEFVKRRIED